ncbi:MAG: hypothetical protein ACI9X4_002242, partial [Glaciecola sp.]
MFHSSHPTNTFAISLLGLMVALVGLCTPLQAAQEYVDQENRYAILNEVSLVEKLDAMVPGDLTFRDLDENAVQLADFFVGDRTIVLTLNYA